MPRIGQYEVGELLGEGGIGRVHVAHDVTLGRDVAIKSLRPALLNDPGFVERFRTEATNLARLSHPNITTVYSQLEQGRSLLIVMERVRGQTLEQMLKAHKGGLGTARSLAIIAEAADGLAYAHAMGIIHRDIKPSNIMVIPSSGLVKIMDFGIAQLRGSQRLTREGSIVGTLAYMAPEQLRGEPADERSDLYSVAIVLYEMLTGSPPFSGKSDYDLMQAQVHAVPLRLRSLVRDADPRIEAALDRALAKRPEQRFASMVEFKEALGVARGRFEAVGVSPSGPITLTDKVSDVVARMKLPIKLPARLPAALPTRLASMPPAKLYPMLAGATALTAGLIAWGALTLFANGAPTGDIKAAPEHAAPPPSNNNENSFESSVILPPPQLFSGRTATEGQ